GARSMSRKVVVWLVALSALGGPLALRAQEGDPYTLQAIGMANGILKAQWMDLRVEQVEVLSVSPGRCTARLHAQTFQWVPDDSRRAADGENITYLFDQESGAPSSASLTAGQAEAAIDRAVATWAGDVCLSKTQIEKRPYTGVDPTIFDAQLGFGGLGD